MARGSQSFLDWVSGGRLMRFSWMFKCVGSVALCCSVWRGTFGLLCFVIFLGVASTTLPWERGGRVGSVQYVYVNLC